MTTITMSKIGDLNTLIGRLTYKAEEFASKYNQRRIDKFAANLAEDPARAFEWSSDAFTAAARVDVGRRVLAWIKMTRENCPDKTDDQIANTVLDEIQRDVLRKTKWPEHSTSQQSNIMSIERNAALADLLDSVRFGN